MATRSVTPKTMPATLRSARHLRARRCFRMIPRNSVTVPPSMCEPPIFQGVAGRTARLPPVPGLSVPRPQPPLREDAFVNPLVEAHVLEFEERLRLVNEVFHLAAADDPPALYLFLRFQAELFKLLAPVEEFDADGQVTLPVDVVDEAARPRRFEPSGRFVTGFTRGLLRDVAAEHEKAVLLGHRVNVLGA